MNFKNITPTRFCFTWLLAVLFNSCQTGNNPETIETYKSPSIGLSQQDLKLVGKLEGFSLRFEKVLEDKGTSVYKIHLSTDKAKQIPPFSLKFRVPSVDIESIWDPVFNSGGQNYNNTMYCRLGSNAPVLCFINNTDENRLNIATSDLINTTVFKTHMDEHFNYFDVEIQFFTEKPPQEKLKGYEVFIRIDNNPESLAKSLAHVNTWWVSENFIQPSVAPEAATDPLYSTWYAFHENMEKGELLKECKLAYGLGYRIVIIDDGWNSTPEIRQGRTSFSFSGDYEVESFDRDMKSLVDSIHAIGMKVMLWYCGAFVGENSKIYQKFKDKTLRYKLNDFYNIDIRYPEVRQHFIDKWEQAFREWGIDGIKVDFLDHLYPEHTSPATAANGRDFASLDKALVKYMDDMQKAVLAIKKDALIEFRQAYATPGMRKYGNMFRAIDCANMESVNRYYVTKLRLMSGNTPIHSDMFTWHLDEPAETAASQFLNVIFAVPQLSVKIDSISDEQKKMVKFYTNFYSENRNVLLFGNFDVQGHMARYPVISSEKNGTKIIAVYEDWVVDTDVHQEIKLINAKKTSQVVLDLPAKTRYHVRIYDCMGNIVDEFTKTFSEGVTAMEVPSSGLAVLSL